MRFLRAARSHELLVGLVLLGIVVFAISAYLAMVSPPLTGPDERAHTAYAIELMHGDLPTIDTPVLDDPERFPQISASLAGQGSPPRRDVWTANHPPLYYLVSVPFLAAADWLDQPGAGLLAMRLLNALGMAISVVLVGLIARELVPGRPAVALLATVLATGCGTALVIGANIFNDGLGNAASSLTLLAGIRLLKYGPSRARIALAALAGTAAVGLRVPGLFAVGLCAGAAFLAVGFAGPPTSPARSMIRRWLRATGAAAIVGGVPALAFGWFYLRNIRLYGDVGATTYLLEKFDRETRGITLAELITDPMFYVIQFRGLFLRMVNIRANPDWKHVLVQTPTALLVLALIGLMVTALIAIASQTRRWWQPRMVAAWLMLFAHAVLIEYSIMSFYLGGGNSHFRYVLPMLPLIMTTVAFGLLGLLAIVRNRQPRRWELIATLGWSVLLLGSVIALQIQAVSRLEMDRGPFLSGHTVGVWGYGGALAVGIAAAVAFLIWLARQVPKRTTEQVEEKEPPEAPELVGTGQARST